MNNMIDSLNDKEFIKTLETMKQNADEKTCKRIDTAYNLAKLLCMYETLGDKPRD